MDLHHFQNKRPIYKRTRSYICARVSVCPRFPRDCSLRDTILCIFVLSLAMVNTRRWNQAENAVMAREMSIHGVKMSRETGGVYARSLPSFTPRLRLMSRMNATICGSGSSRPRFVPAARNADRI